MIILTKKDFRDINFEKKWAKTLSPLKTSIVYSPLQTYTWFKFISHVFPDSFVIYDDKFDFYYTVQVLKTRLGHYGWIRHAPVNIKVFKKAPLEYIKSRMQEIFRICEKIKNNSSSEISDICQNLGWLNVQFRAECPSGAEYKLCRSPKLSDLFSNVLLPKTMVYSMLHKYDFERTVIIDLTKPLKVSSTTRRYYNKGIKMGLELVESDDPNVLYDLLVKTAKRKGYSEWNRTYLVHKYRMFASKKSARIFYVKYKGEIIYGALYVGDKNYIIYDHGGGKAEYLYLNPAYFLHLSVLKLLKQQEYKIFDFGGVGGDTPKHPLYKNSQIKYRFGGEVHNFIHTWDIPLKYFPWVRYYAYTYARNKRLGWYN